MTLTVDQLQNARRILDEAEMRGLRRQRDEARTPRWAPPAVRAVSPSDVGRSPLLEAWEAPVVPVAWSPAEARRWFAPDPAEPRSTRRLRAQRARGRRGREGGRGMKPRRPKPKPRDY